MFIRFVTIVLLFNFLIFQSYILYIRIESDSASNIISFYLFFFFIAEITQTDAISYKRVINPPAALISTWTSVLGHNYK